MTPAASIPLLGSTGVSLPGSPGVLALGLPGGSEWLIVLVIVLLLFGRRLPGVARSLGQGISSFKKGLNEPVDDSAADGKDGDKVASEKSSSAEKSPPSDEG